MRLFFLLRSPCSLQAGYRSQTRPSSRCSAVRNFNTVSPIVSMFHILRYNLVICWQAVCVVFRTIWHKLCPQLPQHSTTVSLRVLQGCLSAQADHWRSGYTAGMCSPCFLWHSNSDSRVRKFRTPDSDSDSGLIVWHNDCELKDDLREILNSYMKSAQSCRNRVLVVKLITQKSNRLNKITL